MPPDPRFAWHPEPELIGITDEATSRPPLERLGADAWRTALDYLYDEALRRAIGEPAGYEELRSLFFGPSGRPAPAPEAPQLSAEVLREFTRRLAPHQLNAWHPRSLSYFTPPPLWLSIVGELLAQVTQQGVDVWHAGPSGAFVEEEVIRWLCDLVGFGQEAFGLLTSGGVMANFLALAVVRDVHLARLLELSAAPRGRALEGVRVYASDQAHFSIARALDELGFPRDTLHVVESDEAFRLRGAAVAEAVRTDRRAGLRPLAIAAVAGSTNTGSVDRLAELADVADREGLWLHVDAAYGAAACLSERDRARVPDLDRADSITIDPHKWFFQAYDIGGLLVRRRADLLATFHSSPEYYRGALPADEPDPASEPLNFYQLGMEGTRRWRALKLWLAMRAHGATQFRGAIQRNLAEAALLFDAATEAPDFQTLPLRPPLSIVPVPTRRIRTSTYSSPKVPTRHS